MPLHLILVLAGMRRPWDLESTGGHRGLDVVGFETIPVLVQWLLHTLLHVSNVPVRGQGGRQVGQDCNDRPERPSDHHHAPPRDGPDVYHRGVRRCGRAEWTERREWGSRGGSGDGHRWPAASNGAHDRHVAPLPDRPPRATAFRGVSFTHKSRRARVQVRRPHRHGQQRRHSHASSDVRRALSVESRVKHGEAGAHLPWDHGHRRCHGTQPDLAQVWRYEGHV
mmetsp:Transcript_72204/g.205252  ORF Transcript_72204/g.205252 Transcript_72204/m.205252 type:complete len:224 (-) Transcript_72204:552-1223(-)